MISWVIPNELARGNRPGYPGKSVPTSEVETWMAEARGLGIRSIICLLSEDQLPFYAEVPGGLVAFYQTAGFTVVHVPANDHQSPPLTDAHLQRIRAVYQKVPKPVLIHCSAGIDRTGMAVRHLQERLG